MVYEAGDVRYVRLGTREVLRRVYVAVRDRNWNTVAPKMANEQITVFDNGFRVTYQMTHRQDEIDFVWDGEIRGSADGTLTFVMDGEARSTFLSNRTGFCVLHGADAAGKNVRVEHIDGTIEVTVFPQLIAPQLIKDGRIQPVQPFAEMRALAYEIEQDVWVEVHFTGDIFELEDQRNWLDASFKTYCRPLRLPFPYEIPVGAKLRQVVTLRLRGQHSTGSDRVLAQDSTTVADVSFTIGRSSLGPFPTIGIGVASHNQPLDVREIERLRVLRPTHLRVNLTLQELEYVEHLKRATAEGRAIGVPLEIALFLSGNVDIELEALLAACHAILPSVVRWLVFQREEKSITAAWLQCVRAQLAQYAPDAMFASGTDLYFTDLNRNRPETAGLDAVSYSVNPQVHAFDNTSLIETAAVITATVESARAFSGATPLIVSPITLKPRFNPVATDCERDPTPGVLPPQVDTRQMSLFGACWTLISLKYLAESGVASATYYETSGWHGTMENEAGSPLPERFVSLPGCVFPLYHVFADVAGCAGSSVLETWSSNTLAVDGLALCYGNRTRVLVANVTNTYQSVIIKGLAAQVQVRIMDEHNVLGAMQNPELFRTDFGVERSTEDGALTLSLDPYAVVRIDSVHSSQNTWA